MPTYRIEFVWDVTVGVSAEATIVADSEDEARRLFMETNGDPDKMTNLDWEPPPRFELRGYIQLPFTIEEITEEY